MLNFQTIILVLALCLASSANLCAQSLSAPQVDRTQEQPKQTQQALPADERGTEKSPLIVRTITAPKSEQEISQEQKDRAEKSELDRKLVKFNSDLANYTLGLGIVAILQFIALVIQAIVLAKTLRVTNRAMTTTERAFVFLDEFDLDWQTVVKDNVPRLERFVIKPRWRNSGTTPTRNNFVRVNWTIWEGDLPRGFEYKFGEPPDGIAPAPIFLGPQASEWSAPIEIPNEVSIRASNRETSIYIWGRADYQDIFENTRPHWIEWCYRIYVYRLGGEVRTQFVAFGPHNRSDEDYRDN